MRASERCALYMPAEQEASQRRPAAHLTLMLGAKYW
jgi:hypothetical protein